MTTNSNSSNNIVTSSTTRTIIDSTTVHDDDYNNNNYRARTRAREANDEQLEILRTCYEDNIGPMTRAAANLIEDALSADFDFDTVLLAIEETGLAPRPSAYYLRAILRNWAQTGIAYSRLHSEYHTIEGRPWWKSPAKT